ncbi:type I restriction-modification system subunit M [Sharpea azabuensis]|uniref:type I restriction-modification system subunit M n=1 Tax=Sharpea azabuensis TaxID=322505 RepID=UPI002409A8B1|nr:class I SAM-dependent DNA methyltransferase [Sharpea azabuensis]MDD6511610.1 class I SAM-dependent DNA methyltransferase [Sharpea azabuensis]
MDLNQQTTANISRLSSTFWNVADLIRDIYKRHEYGNVILPMTVIKRFNDVLAPTKQKVLETYENVKNLEVHDAFLRKASGYSFYNVSKFDFDKLVSDADHIEQNFRDYLNGFSDNVQDIFNNFRFWQEISVLADHNALYEVIKEFNKPEAYLGADKVTTADMGYVFEDLVRQFSESTNEEAGAHFTSRDIVYLMCDLLVAEDADVLRSNGVVKTVYDQTMGTSQMLTCCEERLRMLDKDAKVKLFGQELNSQTYAIAKADALIRGADANNMQLGDTLSDDKFKGYKFDYCISNPPFGVNYKIEKDAVDKEAKQPDGRFTVGTPRVSDGQMLFDLNGLSKLKKDGRMVIVHNGSSLFTGAPGQGESEIRRYIIENDWLEAIIQLPESVFYNTGITTYLWVMSKNKSKLRQGKVQLIDASGMKVSRRKNIGNKRYDLTPEVRNIITKMYGNFKEDEYSSNSLHCESKIFDNDYFGYTRITVETPLKDEDGDIITDKKGKPKADSKKRDYENVPLNEDIHEYFNREVKPYNPDAWIDEKKSVVGYEIPFTRVFYKFVEPESTEDIAKEIKAAEKDIMESLNKLFGEVN